MDIDLLKNFHCMFCERIAPRTVSLCTTCYRFAGFDTLPTGWTFWIESDFVSSSPKRVVCDKCSEDCLNISEKDPRPDKATDVPCPECEQTRITPI